VSRKHKHEEHVNHERWLVSYADFITLLFAFFVVMFAVSQVDSNKVGRFAESVRVATHLGPFDQVGSPVPSLEGEAGGGQTNLNKNDRTNADGFFTGLRAHLEESLKDSLAHGRSKLVENSDGLVIRLKDTAFFDSGSAELRHENLGDLELVARALRNIPVPMRIEGHTDPTPIKTRIFRSNWDLSGARAASVLQLFVSRGMSEDRLSIAGYADRRPVAPNSTPDGRQQNRRVDIVLIRPREEPKRERATMPVNNTSE
jgi:chemotaxis protein MotB